MDGERGHMKLLGGQNPQIILRKKICSTQQTPVSYLHLLDYKLGMLAYKKQNKNCNHVLIK